MTEFIASVCDCIYSCCWSCCCAVTICAESGDSDSCALTLLSWSVLINSDSIRSLDCCFTIWSWDLFNAPFYISDSCTIVSIIYGFVYILCDCSICVTISCFCAWSKSGFVINWLIDYLIIDFSWLRCDSCCCCSFDFESPSYSFIYACCCYCSRSCDCLSCWATLVACIMFCTTFDCTVPSGDDALITSINCCCCCANFCAAAYWFGDSWWSDWWSDWRSDWRSDLWSNWLSGCYCVCIIYAISASYCDSRMAFWLAFDDFSDSS